MREKDTEVYKYISKLTDKQESKIPSTLTFMTPSYEAIVFRLFLGTVDLELDGKRIKQNINYCKLDYETRGKRLSYKSIFDNNIPIINNFSDFDKYMSRARRNSSIYKQFLFELSNYFYQKQKKAYISAFIHLYRSVEYLSYSFPLIYASKASDYIKSYNHLKSFFNEEQKNELKFFQIFLKTSIESSILEVPINICIQSPKMSMNDEIMNIFNQLLHEIIEDTNNYTITIKFKNIFNMILTLRNRFFHMSTTNPKNITSTKVMMDYLYKCINDHILNFIAIIYCEITKYGLEEL